VLGSKNSSWRNIAIALTTGPKSVAVEKGIKPVISANLRESAEPKFSNLQTNFLSTTKDHKKSFSTATPDYNNNQFLTFRLWTRPC
jgi:hypothetical protein